MLFIIIALILIVSIVAACLFIEKRANEQDPKYMTIRDNIIEFCKN